MTERGDDDARADFDVLIAVPPGRSADALVTAVGQHHLHAHVRLLWAGEPTRRPEPPAAMAWEESSTGELDLLRVETDALGWLVALDALADSTLSRSTVALIAGTTAVAGSLLPFLGVEAEVITAAAVTEPGGLPADGRAPAPEDLFEAGTRLPAVLGLGPQATGPGSAADWLRQQLRAAPDVPVGRLFDAATTLFDVVTTTAPGLVVSPWSWPADGLPPSLVVAPHFDPALPWVLDTELDGTPRVSLAVPERHAVLHEVADQLAGRARPLRLHGGLEVDKIVRGVVRERRDAPRHPFTDPGTFRSWLHRPYWMRLHQTSDDLVAAFPHPTGIDAARFAAWARRAAARGAAPLLIDPGVLSATPAVHRVSDRSDGVNLVGYFHHQSGVANIGRRVAEILTRHGVPHTVSAWDRTVGPRVEPPPLTDQRLEFADSLVFINADQYAFLPRDIPELFGPGRRVIALSYWELSTLVGAAPVDASQIDEIWAATTFMMQPFGELGVPVRHVPIPTVAPAPSARRRSEFAPLADADGRFVFGMVFDHMSVMERKNPIAAVRAFQQAFAPDSGPLLLIKTINAARNWQEHERLLAEIGGRSDIVVWDELLPYPDHVALMASFDALIALHRSEGLGLHLIEAMWLGVPVITTGYSGNVDFMDGASSVLVDHRLVPVEHGGFAYPASAQWADPDVGQAAAAMARLAADPAAAAALGAAGRAHVESLPGEQAFVETLVDVLGVRRDVTG